MERVYAWKDRDNAHYLPVVVDGTALTSDEIDGLTKVEIRVNDVYYDSVSNPEYFDLLTKSDEGKVGIKAGLLPLDSSVTRDIVEFIIYSPVYTNGLFVSQFLLLMQTDAAEIPET